MSAYLGIVSARAKAGDLTGARATAAKIGDEGVKAWAGRAIATSQATASDMAGAKATAAQIGREDIKVLVFSEIAVAQAETGDAASARQTVQEAIESSDRATTDLGDRCQWLSMAARALFSPPENAN